MNFRDKVQWTPALARRSERLTIWSSCCTSMGDVPFTDAAVIILYANMLGASEAFSLITTSMLSLAIGFFSIFAVRWVRRDGSYQWTILKATAMALAMFGVITAAPYFGSWAVPVLLLALMFFSVNHTIYMAAWFPLLDSFLTRERRSGYLGRMRFSWQLASALLLSAISFFVGKNPPIGKLQLVMLFSMLVFSCKFFFIAAVPSFETQEQSKFGFHDGLMRALRNKPMAGLSVYLFILNIASYGTIPVTTLYLKKSLHAPDNVIVLISAVVLGGMLCGSYFAGRIIRSWGMKATFLLAHCGYGIVNLLLFFTGRSLFPSDEIYWVIGILLFCYSFLFACSNISSSSEMMTLATPGNKVMAMAFCNSFYYGGLGLSRLLTSLIVGSGALAPLWVLGNWQITRYQTLFLLYALCVVLASALLLLVPAVFPEAVSRTEKQD